MWLSLRAAFAIVVAVAMANSMTVDGLSSPSSSSPIPPPPPISVPVWSFATASTEPCNTITSMNIMTFCTPVSVSSPKLWALSFYHGTLTKDSFLGNDDEDNDDDVPSTGILQLLTYDHRHLVPILGKKSGRDIDKSVACGEEGFPWWKIPNPTPPTTLSSVDETEGFDTGDGRIKGFEVLPGCALYLQVECRRSSKSLIDAGDHVVAICKVTRTGVWQPELGKIQWLDEFNGGDIDTAMSLPLAAIDESRALYSGRLRQEGIL
ncbi:unnamed protein product [Pseudo-nitzschia multistriata]|uniref:Uncharacterized protein n=1 Tax=Pseudo-nitzschia multistriata TaxID=183589 RepID=A0A448Z454_9STRA|nr:unnamed protein product [Pseudo-nitzschia multistriata]